MCWPTSRGVTRRPSGPAWRSPPTRRTGPIASSPRSTTAAIWSGRRFGMVDPNVAFTAVRASRGKVVRAEPVAALYHQGRVHHIGTFPQLEDQMTNFTSDIDRAYRAQDCRRANIDHERPGSHYALYVDHAAFRRLEGTGFEPSVPLGEKRSFPKREHPRAASRSLPGRPQTISARTDRQAAGNQIIATRLRRRSCR